MNESAPRLPAHRRSADGGEEVMTTLDDAVAAVDRLPAVAPETIAVACEVIHERKRQNAKWGVQRHPDGTGADRARVFADAMRRVVDNASETGETTWAAILLEEVAEAMAEQPDSPNLRTELLQIAAVCQQWVEAIDRRATAEPSIPHFELRWGPGRGLVKGALPDPEKFQNLPVADEGYPGFDHEFGAR